MNQCFGQFLNKQYEWCDMRKILIVFAHPAFIGSTINAAMRRAVEPLEHVTFHDLYACYPDFSIDVAQEQQLCADHDVIIFQHPFYWYSTPSILKEWQDLVLQHTWAYGSKGAALQGKYFLQALTAGSSADDYQHDGINEATIAELLAPIQAMARLCKMVWLPPFAVLGVHRGLPEQAIHTQVEAYRRAIVSLRDESVEMSVVESSESLCDLFILDQPGRI